MNRIDRMGSERIILFILFILSKDLSKGFRGLIRSEGAVHRFTVPAVRAWFKRIGPA